MNSDRKSHTGDSFASAAARGNWRIHATLVLWAIAVIAFEHRWHGWGEPVGVAGLSIGLNIHAARKAWHETWFWITIAILAALQAPLMIHFQPLIARLGWGFMFPGALADFLSVAIIMQCFALVFSQVYARNSRQI